MYSTRDFTGNLSGNLFGGITAAIVALPLALAFGIASGVGPAAGLYGAASVGFFAAIFGGTPTQVSGPTGPMTVVMTAMTAAYIARYPEIGLTLAFSTVLLGGLLQVLFGLSRLGKYIIMVPYPVISGFMSGIGVIIILLQLGPLLGHASVGGIATALAAMPEQVNNYNTEALVAGCISLAIVFSWRGRYNRIIPSPLLALVVATFTLNVIFPNSSIDTLGDIPSILPTLHVPTFRFEILQSMLTNALMLAVLGSIDSLLTSLVADNITGTQHDSDQELIGQGIGNVVAGLIGGLPGAGATMRTMVNIRAGGSGPLSGVVHALLLVSMVGGLGFLFRSIPLAALAGILIKVGIDIIDWSFIKRLHRLPKFPVMLMITVLLLTVFVDLITAVFVGVFIKNIVTINRLSDLQLGTLIVSDGVQDLERLPEDERRVLSEHAGASILLRITGPLSYAVGRGLNLRLRQKLGATQLLLIDIADASIVGISTAMVLEDLVRNALGKNIVVKIVGARPESHYELWQIGLIDLIGKGNCIGRIEEAF